VKLWPSYLAFLTSFGTIGIMWVIHIQRTPESAKSLQRIFSSRKVVCGALSWDVTEVARFVIAALEEKAR
jgi:hypothetical protein